MSAAISSAPSPAAIKPAGRAARREWWGLLFIAPWLIGFVIFTAGSMIASLWLSFCHYDIATVKYIGLTNYRHMLFTDPQVWKSLWVTSLYTLVTVPLGLTGSLLLAVLLNQHLPGKAVWRAMFYIPTLVPAVAASYLWMLLLNKQVGLINVALSHIGIIGPNWLGTTQTALPAMMLMSLWGIGGGRMIIFLAGLQEVSASLYEAAAIDGASLFQQFRSITLPMLTPMIFFNLTLGVIGSFQTFATAYLMTGGGPEESTLFFALKLFREAFSNLHLGYASALAWLLFLILMIVTGLQFLSARYWVHYQEGTG